MSTFCGKLREYESLSIDRFDGINLKSTAFFLSHFHKDHTVGLSSEKFAQQLRNGNGRYFLYCTEVTRILLLADPEFQHLDPYISPLVVNDATTVHIPDPHSEKTNDVTVTLLSANHCPGSVMFLFEGDGGRVLYTGDFRWPVGEASKQPALHDDDDRLKPIDAVYADTTFCFPEACYIPSHDDCVDLVVGLCKEWVYRSPAHVVCVSSTVKYGHERLLADVARSLGKKVHMCKTRLCVYEKIDDLGDVFSGAEDSQIHVCRPSSCAHMRRAQTTNHLRVIRPSTMWFLHNTHARRALVRTPRMARVCYCFHSSYGELRHLIAYLRPTRVYPNVVPPGHRDSHQVQRTLNSFLTPHDVPASPHQPLGQLCVFSSRLTKDSDLSDSGSLYFGTPEKKYCVSASKTASASERQQFKGGETANAPSDSQTTVESSRDTSNDSPSSSYVPSEIGGKISDWENSEAVEYCDDVDVLGYLSGDSDDEDYTALFSREGGEFYGKFGLMKTSAALEADVSRVVGEVVDSVVGTGGRQGMCEGGGCDGTNSVGGDATCVGDSREDSKLASDASADVSLESVGDDCLHAGNVDKSVDIVKENVASVGVGDVKMLDSGTDSTPVGDDLEKCKVDTISSEPVNIDVLKTVASTSEKSYELASNSSETDILPPTPVKNMDGKIDFAINATKDVKSAKLVLNGVDLSIVGSRSIAVAVKEDDLVSKANRSVAFDNLSLHANYDSTSPDNRDEDMNVNKKSDDGSSNSKDKLIGGNSDASLARTCKSDPATGSTNNCGGNYVERLRPQDSEKPGDNVNLLENNLEVIDDDCAVVESGAANCDTDKYKLVSIESSSDVDSGKISGGLLMDCDEIMTSDSNDIYPSDSRRHNGHMSDDKHVSGTNEYVKREDSNNTKDAVIVLSDTSESDTNRDPASKRKRLRRKSLQKNATATEQGKNKKQKVSISSSETISEVTVSSMSSNDILQGLEQEVDRLEQTRLWCENTCNQSRPKRAVVKAAKTDECSSGFVDLTQDSDSDCIAYT